MPKPKKPKMAQRKKKKSSSFRLSSRNIPLILIVVGIFLLSIPSLFYVNQTIQLTFFTPAISPSTSPSNLPLPSALTIPSLHVSLSVQRTFLSHNTWGIAKNGASYLATSARPGEKGAIILYGHNTDDRFGPIRWLTKDKIIEIKTTDNKTHKYKVTQTLEVSPNEINVFNQTQETLILYTCSGFADTKRFIVIAKPDKESTNRIDLETTF